MKKHRDEGDYFAMGIGFYEVFVKNTVDIWFNHICFKGF